MKTYKYFCDACGLRFESHEEALINGFFNDNLFCPKCGAFCIYPDTPEEAALSVNRLNQEGTE